MEVEVTVTIWFDVDRIIKTHNLNSETTDEAIIMALNSYTDSMDEYSYDLVDDEVFEKVFNEILRRLNRPSSFIEE